MLLDQGVGAHHAQVEYVAVGAWWTWVSGESVTAATLDGKWSDVVSILADRGIERISADRTTTAIHADRELIEVRG